MSIVHQYRPLAHSASEGKPPHSLLYFIFNFWTNLIATLDFNDIRGSRGLDQKVNLATCRPAIPALAHISVRCRRLDSGISDPKEANYFHRIVDDQVLELKPHHRIPGRQRGTGL